MEKNKVSIVWLRRDIRIDDHVALYYALKEASPVLIIFIFDTSILNLLEDKEDRRLCFIYENIEILKKKLEEYNSSLSVHYGEPIKIFKELAKKYDIKAIFFNRDYEPQAIERDKKIETLCKTLHINCHSFKDQVIFEKNELLKQNDKPYTRFTFYMKKWYQTFQISGISCFDTKKYLSHLFKTPPLPMLSLKEMGFKKINFEIPPIEVLYNDFFIKNYKESRNLVAQENSTSKLSVHLRFGTISIREVIKIAIEHNSTTFLNELIWREFFMMILFHFPFVVKEPFRPTLHPIPWINNPKQFSLWCDGKTGVPIIDAGMRQLNQTGFMHNRVRMIVANYLVKNLLIDWQWGEKYFAKKLLDFELSSNNGNWQWCSGTGCDAMPYFRIFNPDLQTKKFDPKKEYIRRWVQEYGTDKYPHPIISYQESKQRALSVFKKANKKN